MKYLRINTTKYAQFMWKKKTLQMPLKRLGQMEKRRHGK